MTKRNHLSSISDDVLLECAQKLDTTVDELVIEFEKNIWKPELDDYSRKLVEYCCSKAFFVMCPEIAKRIDDGSFGRFTFNLMLAWETPSAASEQKEEEEESNSEKISKENHDVKTTEMMLEAEDEDDASLFYSDIMPLLVDHKDSVGEDSFVWLGTLVPLPADVVNGRFTFDTLTASTSNNRLHFPAYDKYLKEIDKCFKHLQNQDAPTGVELADDEFILHVEGTASSQRVVRHIGGTSWPGRLTLTNYALYFEASGVISYDTALKLDLSKDIEQSVKTAATGPWGAPLFDKAMVYDSTDLGDSFREEGVVLEFPEIASSTRRDHWLALTKEIMLLHQFLSRYKVQSHDQSWEMHSRTIMGIIRLHAAREMLRIRPPEPKSFLIFALYEELPKGDYVLEQLAESLKKVDLSHPCSASSILRNMNVITSAAVLSSKALGEGKQIICERASVSGQPEDISPLEAAILESREEAKEINVAKATAEELKEEGISDSVQVLLALLKPSKGVLNQLQEVLTWQRPVVSVLMITTLLLIIYKEWAGVAIAGLILWGVARIIQRRKMEEEIPDKIVVCTASDQTTMESIVSAQHGLRSAYDMVQMVNIVLLKIHSILIWKTPKHTIHAIVAMIAAASLLLLVPFKYFLMALILVCFLSNADPLKKRKSGGNKQGGSGNRRVKEWWDSIPIIGVELVDEFPTPPNK